MKKYPERPPKHDYSKETRNICECGHVETVHVKDCIHCMCPKFKYEKTMTIQELLDCNWNPIDENAQRSRT